jgi:hypothetical protein
MDEHEPTGDRPTSPPAALVNEIAPKLEVISNVLFIISQSFSEDKAVCDLIAKAEQSMAELSEILERYVPLG